MGLKWTKLYIFFIPLTLLLVAGTVFLLMWQMPRPAILPPDPTQTKPFDPGRAALLNTWQSYKARFISTEGRTIDRGRNDVTTSEGQAYTLLRAVWQQDRATFERVLSWTNRNLRVRNDNLFASLWGQDKAGNWDALDHSTNSGADQDIALALILASRAWPDAEVATQAQAQLILNDLWQKAVITVGGKPYLTAGDWAAIQLQPSLNPSYFAPYAYRLFARYDTNPAHNWNSLIDTSFAVLYGCSGLNEPSRLPPDWCSFEPTSGTFHEAVSSSLSTNYGYQAFRVYWRLALDEQWNGKQDERSRTFLQWSSKGDNPLNKAALKLAAIYDRNGTSLAPEDSSTYAGTLGLLMTAQPDAAANFYQKMLGTYHELDGGTYYFWDEPQNYYQQNWLWFGVALYNQTLKPEPKP